MRLKWVEKLNSMAGITVVAVQILMVRSRVMSRYMGWCRFRWVIIVWMIRVLAERIIRQRLRKGSIKRVRDFCSFGKFIRRKLVQDMLELLLFYIDIFVGEYDSFGEIRGVGGLGFGFGFYQGLIQFYQVLFFMSF